MPDDRATESLSLIDRAMAYGPLDKRVPVEIETPAKALFANESRGLTGIEWVWNDASSGVRNKYRLRAAIELLGLSEWPK